MMGALHNGNSPVEVHNHAHPQGALFQALYTCSMLFGRGALARVVANAADPSADDVVVDVGCGPGTAVRRARRDGAARAVGVDPDGQMLRLGRWVTRVSDLTGVTFVEGSAEAIPLASASASVVWAVQSVHHWNDRSRGLEEALRVLAPGGRLVVAERAVTPGARGLAAHGLNHEESDQMLESAAAAGFVDVQYRAARAGRRNLVVITARAPSSEGN